jgi:lantibiotic biosynthesis protein
MTQVLGQAVRTEMIKLSRTLRQDAQQALADSWDLWLCLDLYLCLLESGRRGDDDDGDPGGLLASAIAAVTGLDRLDPWLYRGAAQVGWLLAVSESRGIRVTADTSGIQDYVASWVDSYPDNYDVDLPRGILGLGVYGLSQHASAAGQHIVSGVLKVIEARMQSDGSGAFVCNVDARWSRPDTVGQPGWRNLGMAHGNLGVAAFLAIVARSETRLKSEAARLLNPLARWLAGQALEGGPHVYPAFAEAPEQMSRTGWCYGDPGASVGLALAADVLDDPALRQRLMLCARRAAASSAARPEGRTGVWDCGICHGAAGLCYAGCRWSELLGGDYSEYILRWFGHISRERSDGPLRYRSTGAWRPDISLLGGDIGVACVLWRCATGSAASWERLLLMR